MKLLHLDSSILGSASISRELTRAIVDAYRATQPNLQVTYRDLGGAPLPHLTSEWTSLRTADIDSLSSEQRDQARLTATLIEELKSADVLIIGAPLYNFTIPTGLKAWIDQIAVSGQTFRYGKSGPEGLVPNKKTYLVTTSGGIYAGTPVSHMHEGYLKQVLNFIGIQDIEVVRVEGLGMTDERTKALAAARAQIERISEQLQATSYAMEKIASAALVA
jgi:FMN-dependent NADH-azoreductase